MFACLILTDKLTFEIILTFAFMSSEMRMKKTKILELMGHKLTYPEMFNSVKNFSILFCVKVKHEEDTNIN